MKYIFLSILIAFTFSLNAQSDLLNNELEKMSEKQKMELLGYAVSLKKNDFDKQLKKALKKLSPEQKAQVLDYAKNTKGKKRRPKKRPNSQLSDAEKLPLTKIEFETPEFDFGEVTEGEKITYVYKFKNTGKKPLVISNAKGSCGCTVPKWPKEAIKPGKKGEIEVVFNTKGKRGNQVKTVTISANTAPEKNMIRIKGKVNPKG